MKYNITNTIDYYIEELNIRKYNEMVKDGKVVGLPQILQRKLREEEWSNKDFKNAKEYNDMIFMKSADMNIDLVKLDIVIERLETKLKGLKSKKDKTQFVKWIKQLKKHQKNGAEQANLDGQSRTNLATNPYLEDKFKLDNITLQTVIESDGEEDSILTEKYFSELPEQIQNIYLDERFFNVRFITNFKSFDDIVIMLVRKNLGNPWLFWQIIFISNALTTQMSNLRKYEKKLKQNWNKCIHSKFGDKFKEVTDGISLQLLLIHEIFENNTILNDEGIENVFKGKNNIKSSILKRIENYFEDWFEMLGYVKGSNNKSHMINYIILRELFHTSIRKIDNKFSKYFPKLKSPYIIKDNYQFADYIYKLMKKMQPSKDVIKTKPKQMTGDIKNPWEATWQINQDNKWEEKQNGFAYHNRLFTMTDLLKRLKLLIKYIDFDKLEKKEIIVKTDKGNPNRNDSIVYNNFKDYKGNEIPVKDLPKIDDSHKKDRKNYPELRNKLDNRVLEDSDSNRKRGAKELIIK